MNGLKRTKSSTPYQAIRQGQKLIPSQDDFAALLSSLEQRGASGHCNGTQRVLTVCILVLLVVMAGLLVPVLVVAGFSA